MEQLARHYVRLLEAVVAAPEAPLHRLELLDASERHTAAGGVQRARRAGARGDVAARCSRRRRRARRRPSRWCAGRSALTYAALNARANRLAHISASARGVGPETLGGLALERSLAMVVALLGILKAGGAYLPLDAGLPGSAARDRS